MAVNIVTGMTGIEHITSHDDRARNASQFGRGKYVFDIGRKFSATAVDDNLVRIQDGMCINQGTQMGIEPNDYADVEIDNGLLGTNRHDIIVMRYEKNEETLLEKASLVVVKGVNSSEPVDPTYQTGNILDGGDLVDDMPLYRVVIEGVNLVSIEPLFEVFDGDVGSILEELDNKVNKVTGKGLSTNDYTNEDKTKLDGIDTGAEVNVQSDWSQNDNTADDFIKHKPGIPSKTSDLQNDSDFVSDANYVHTDNNYTNADKEDVAKIEDLEHSLSTTSTATGNPISISDSAHVNAEKLVVTLEPIQSGSGDPSPENIRHISGYDETSVVIKDTTENPTATNTYTLQFGDTVYGAEVDFVSGVATVKYGYADLGDLNYYYTADYGGMFFAIVNDAKYSGNLSLIGYDCYCSQYKSRGNTRWPDLLNGEINVGSDTAGDNHPYVNIKDKNYSDVTSFKNAMQGVQLVYELATPTTIQLTPQQIKMLKGNNVLVADGDMELVYQVDSVVGDVKEWAEEEFLPKNSATAQHNYSTQEQVVGTWIDGSTLYEKTLHFTGTYTGAQSLTIGVSNLDIVIPFIAFAVDNYDSIVPLPYVNGTAELDPKGGWLINSSKEYINIRFGSSFVANELWFTIQYTKTTD